MNWLDCSKVDDCYQWLLSKKRATDSRGCAMEYLESLGAKIVINGTIVYKLYKGKSREHRTKYFILY